MENLLKTVFSFMSICLCLQSIPVYGAEVITTQQTSGGITMTAPQAPAPIYRTSSTTGIREKYIFVNWNTERDGSGETLYPGDLYVVTEPIDLYAQWEPDRNRIRYDGNGANGMMPDSTFVLGQTSGKLAKNTYSKKGSNFLGWSTVRNGPVVYADEATISLPSGSTGTTIILYAKWEMFDYYTLKIAKDEVRVRPVTVTETRQLAWDEETIIPAALSGKTLTVSYNLNRGTKSTEPKWVTTNPTDAMYTRAKLNFRGWQLYEEAELNSEYAFLEVLYQPGDTAKNLARSQTKPAVLFPYWAGETVTLPVANCDGYYFEGWSNYYNTTDESQIIHVTEGEENQYKPKGNELLYASWTPKKYNVELVATHKDASATDIVSSQKTALMTFDDTIPEVTPPTSDRFIFLGYYDKLDADGIPIEGTSKQYYRRLN